MLEQLLSKRLKILGRSKTASQINQLIHEFYLTFFFISDLDPLPTVQNEIVNVQKGHGVKISLPSFKSYPFPPTVEWHLNANIMAEEGPNHQVTLSKDLVLLDTETQDDGSVYQAEILNGLNGQTSTTQTYTVRVSGESHDAIEQLYV